MLRRRRDLAFYARYIVGNLIVDAMTLAWIAFGWSSAGTWVMTIDRKFGILGQYTTWGDRSLMLAISALMVAIAVASGALTPYVVARVVQGAFFIYLGIIAYNARSTGTIYVIIGVAALALALQTIKRRIDRDNQITTADRLAALATARHRELMIAQGRDLDVTQIAADEATAAHKEAREITRSIGVEGRHGDVSDFERS